MKATSLGAQTFTVVDIETTGLSAQQHRITEVALLRVERGKIVDRRETLLNPEQYIPPFIAQYTGISNAMVFGKPTFAQAAGTFTEFLAPSDRPVIVGHNIRFDHGFLKESYLRSFGSAAPYGGLEACDLLCTCRLSKRLLPKLRSHSLGKVVEHLGIPLKHRHRAMGDAEATALLLLDLLDRAEREHDITSLEELLRFQYSRPVSQHRVTKSFSALKDDLERFPERPGVYVMYGKSGEVIYVGKAKNLRDRVSSYFTPSAIRANAKVSQMMKLVKEIKFEESGSELAAMLMESRRIKEAKPRFNSLDKRYRSYTFLRLNPNERFPKLDAIKWPQADGADYYGPFRSRASVDAMVEVLNRAFKLRECEGEITVDKNFKPCFYYDIQRCGAPCAGLQSEAEYRLEVSRFRTFMSGGDDGILQLLTRMIEAAAEELNFEEAQYLKIRLLELRRVLGAGHESSAPLNTKNCVIVAPALMGKVEVFFVRFGRLAKQVSVEFTTREMAAEWFQKQLRMYYSLAAAIPPQCGRPEIDEMRIISTWLDRKRREGTAVLYLPPVATDILEELVNAACSFAKPETFSSPPGKEIPPAAEPPTPSPTFTDDAVRTAKRLTLRPMTIRKI